MSYVIVGLRNDLDKGGSGTSSKRAEINSDVKFQKI